MLEPAAWRNVAVPNALNDAHEARRQTMSWPCLLPPSLLEKPLKRAAGFASQFSGVERAVIL